MTRHESKREWDRAQAAAFVRAGLTSKGTVRKNRRWEVPGQSSWAREKFKRRYCMLPNLCDRIAVLLARSQRWLPAELRKESVALASQLARIKKSNPKRAVRIV
jgi:hypothetical protein